MCSNLCTSLYKVCTIYISLLKINKINFITVLFIKFLKNRAAGHWIKSLSIVCSQNTESTHLQESVFPSAFGFREYGFLQVCTFPYSGNKQWITDIILHIKHCLLRSLGLHNNSVVHYRYYNKSMDLLLVFQIKLLFTTELW